MAISANTATRLFFAAYALALAAMGCSTAHAQGGPPMLTDDPGMPGDGVWEINVAATSRHDTNGWEGELPLLDINYGLSEYIQLKYEVPWVVLDEDDGESRSGLGNSLFGVKWRFHDAGPSGWQMSVYPQLEVRNPGSDSAERGLAEGGTAFLLPFQFQRSFAAVAVNFEVGREFRSHDDDTWIGGLVIGDEWRDWLQGMVELHGESSESFHDSAIAVNVGARIDAASYGTLLISVGREVHNDLEEKATVFGYLGWQMMF